MPAAAHTKQSIPVYHVLHEKGEWAIRTASGSAGKGAHTKAQAVQAAKTLAKGKSAEIVIHSSTGRIVARHACGSHLKAGRTPARAPANSRDEIPSEHVELFNAVTAAAAR